MKCECGHEFDHESVAEYKHRLLCGDCTDGNCITILMDGELAGCVLTDPPYGQSQKGVINDEPEKLDRIINDAIMNIPVENGAGIFFQSPRTFPVLLDHARNNGWLFERMLWLYKTAQCVYPWRGWLLTSESIIVLSRGNPGWKDKKPYSHDCYQVSEVSGELGADCGWHGSVKPISVVTDLLSRISGDVYDPFLGSGTTLIACEQLGRRCRAVEISPGYVAVALQRWADATGKEPKLMTS